MEANIPAGKFNYLPVRDFIQRRIRGTSSIQTADGVRNKTKYHEMDLQAITKEADGVIFIVDESSDNVI